MTHVRRIDGNEIKEIEEFVDKLNHKFLFTTLLDDNETKIKKSKI